MSTDTIVLIHGLWMTPLSWEHWIDRYSGRATRCSPAWPGMDGAHRAAARRTRPIDHLGIEEIVDHYDAIIRGLDRPPIIMGHSFGGAFTQLLLDRGLGAAGVAIDSAPIKGLALPVTTLRSGFPVLKSPKNTHRAVTLTPEEFHYAFTNTLSDEESRRCTSATPCPVPGACCSRRRSPTSTPTPTEGRLPQRRPRPAAHHRRRRGPRRPGRGQRSEAKHQRKSAAITAYQEFPGRSHFTLGQDGWEEVADFALDWAVEHASVPATTGT